MDSPLVIGDVIVRDYRPGEDDGAINELEKRATQHRKVPILSQLFKANIEHVARFDAKASQFDAYHILCLEDSANGTLCGVVACGTKDVLLQGQTRRCGYIYDLRIHEDYQRRGLATRLSNELESRCKKAGVDFFYLTVNSNNEKAKALYKRLGFLHASHRWPLADILLWEVPQVPDVDVLRLSPAEALPVFQEAYRGRDMSLPSLRGLFESPLFEGALLARGGDSSAGICLWNAGTFQTFAIEQVILPTQWYTYTVTKAGFLGAALLLGFWVSSGLWSLWARGAWVSFGVGSVATLAAAAGLVKVTLLVRFLSDWVLGRKVKTRCRLFAPFARGPRGAELLSAVLARAKSEARDKGYIMVICNLDRDDPFRDTYGPGRFRTEFLQKPLVGAFQSAVFRPDSFHDPRDI